MNATTSRIMIVDDHPLVRRGLRELISDEADLEMCGEADSAEDALQIVETAAPDLMIIDISLKGINGIELMKRVKSRYPEIKMLVASMHDETLFAERSLCAGAMGYIHKEEAPENVILAIRQVLGGTIYLSQEMTSRLLHGIVSGMDMTGQSPIETLSDRELEVFGMIGRGLSTRDIAGKLHLSVKTIESYREHIKTKLNLDNAAELTRHAIQWVLENG